MLSLKKIYTGHYEQRIGELRITVKNNNIIKKTSDWTGVLEKFMGMSKCASLVTGKSVEEFEILEGLEPVYGKSKREVLESIERILNNV